MEISPVYNDMPLDDAEKRTVFLRYDAESNKAQVFMVDQTLLPGKFAHHICYTLADVIESISTMIVRGAPAIGVTGAYGMVMAALELGASKVEDLTAGLVLAKEKLDVARPTAVNLMWATQHMLHYVQAKQYSDVQLCVKAMIREADRLAEEDILTNLKMAKHGATIVPEFSDRPTNILHHCNTGVLACIDWGTALGVIHYCQKSRRNIHVWVNETRPRLQGARLTAWELMQAKCPMHLSADSVAGSLMRRGLVDVVLFGADRVAANGDTVNKIGTYNVAALAKENGIPVYAVVPTSTIDLSLSTGDQIPIEERSSVEVTGLIYQGHNIAPDNVPVYNPAFDNTPHKYLTGIITEEGICYPPYEKSLREAKVKAESRLRASWSQV